MDVQQQALTDDFVYLTGRPTIRDFLGFARRYRLSGKKFEKEPLIREWQQAAEHLRELEQSEKGLADEPDVQPLPEAMREIADAELDNPTLRSVWSGLRYRWQLVELDRLVVFQKTINLRFVDTICAQLKQALTAEEIIRTAVGKSWQAPPIRVTRSEEYTFLCVSDSNDIRILDMDVLDPALIQGYDPPGNAGVVIGICVGFTINVLSALQIRNRLVLFNGSHRAFALRQLGVTHVPCLVATIAREDEFDLRAPEPVRENRELYLKSARPPLFKDYFDPKLRTILTVPRANHLVQLQIGYQKIALAAMQ